MRRQLAWSFGAQVFGLVLPPLLLIALARVLTPADFGVFVIIMMVIAVVMTVTIAPLNEVIIRSENDDIGNFIFTVQLMVGLACVIIIYFVADGLAFLFKKPELTMPLRVSSLTFLIVPFVTTAISIGMRHVSFKAVFFRKVITPLANACVSVPLAFSGVGYWALVWGQIAGYIVAGFIIIGMGGWSPKLNFNFQESLEDLKFSSQMIIQGLVRWIRNQSDRAILGFSMPFSEIGEYDMASKLAGLPFMALGQPVVQVLYAVMSEQNRQGQTIQDLYILAQRRLLMLSMPLAVMMAFNAEGIILIALGEAWRGMVPIFVILSISASIGNMISGNVEVFKAKGVPKKMTQLMIIMALTTVPVFLWLAPKGVYALSLGVLALVALFSPLSVFITIRLLRMKVLNYIRQVMVLPVSLMCLVTCSSMLIQQLPLNLFVATFLSLTVGCLIITTAVFLMEPDMLKLKNTS